MYIKTKSQKKREQHGCVYVIYVFNIHRATAMATETIKVKEK